jgi:hypothetical protein
MPTASLPASVQTPTSDPGTADPPALAREFLLAVRRGEASDPSVQALAGLDGAALAAALESDGVRRAFWTNVYNAAVQRTLAADPDRYDSRRRFFARPVVTVAGHSLSPNDIEHGILRRSKSAFGLGYLPRIRPDAFERRHRVETLDPRVHFALNCGAAACPPIAAYEADRIDEQLRLATESYLESTVEYDAAAGVVRVPRLFLWYVGDFGGRSGTRAFLREHGAVPPDSSPRVRYLPYDWDRSLGDYVDR